MVVETGVMTRLRNHEAWRLALVLFAFVGLLAACGTSSDTTAIEAMDVKEPDSGFEHIGEPNQQMGDGGLIAQVTEVSTGNVVAVTDSGWKALVVHHAPLNTDCEHDAHPDATCEFRIAEMPPDRASPEVDDPVLLRMTMS